MKNLHLQPGKSLKALLLLLLLMNEWIKSFCFNESIRINFEKPQELKKHQMKEFSPGGNFLYQFHNSLYNPLISIDIVSFHQETSCQKRGWKMKFFMGILRFCRTQKRGKFLYLTKIYLLFNPNSVCNWAMSEN